MPETYGYVRTSRTRVSELADSDPETQRQQLLAAGVALSHIYQDVGISGTSGTNSRRAGTLWIPDWLKGTPSNQDDVFAFQLRGQNRWTTTVSQQDLSFPPSRVAKQ